VLCHSHRLKHRSQAGVFAVWRFAAVYTVRAEVPQGARGTSAAHKAPAQAACRQPQATGAPHSSPNTKRHMRHTPPTPTPTS
jgi:hypothetical protein